MKKRDKGFIRDHGKIRFCDSNIAKMSLIEYIKIDWRKAWKGLLKDTFSLLSEGIADLAGFFVAVLTVIFFPAFLLLRAHKGIRHAKYCVAAEKKYQAALKEEAKNRRGPRRSR